MKPDSTASKAKAIGIANKVAAFLRERGASKVMLFGSLVTVQKAVTRRLKDALRH
jgi:hypothetical protein